MALGHPGVVKRTVAHVNGLRGSPTSRSRMRWTAIWRPPWAVRSTFSQSTKPERKPPSFRLIRSGSSRAFCKWSGDERADDVHARKLGAGSAFARLPYGRALRCADDTCEALDVCGGIFLLLVSWLSTAAGAAALQSASASGSLPGIASNDNSVAGGHLEHGELHLALLARRGLWYPDGPGTIGLPIEAFGEAGGALSIPGPLVRVPVGTRIVASIRNELAHDLTIRGLARPSEALTTVLHVAHGRTRQVAFVLDRPGTFGYYGSDTGETIDARIFADAELSGAIVVEAPHARRVDHVFILGLHAPVKRKDGSPNFIYFLETINGRAYPATERLAYARGRKVRWERFQRDRHAAPDASARVLFPPRSAGRIRRSHAWILSW